MTGTVSNGRLEEEDGARVLGLFLNSLPLRVNLVDGSWRELIEQVHQRDEANLPYRRFPLHEIQRLVGGESLFQTLFNFVHFHVYRGVTDIEGIKIRSAQTFEQTNFSLVVNVAQALFGEELSVSLVYDVTVLTREQVERMAGYYQCILRSIAENIDAPHYRAVLLSTEEHQKMLVGRIRPLCLIHKIGWSTSGSRRRRDAAGKRSRSCTRDSS